MLRKGQAYDHPTQEFGMHIHRQPWYCIFGSIEGILLMYLCNPCREGNIIHAIMKHEIGLGRACGASKAKRSEAKPLLSSLFLPFLLVFFFVKWGFDLVKKKQRNVAHSHYLFIHETKRGGAKLQKRALPRKYGGPNLGIWRARGRGRKILGAALIPGPPSTREYCVSISLSRWTRAARVRPTRPADFF